MRRISHWSLNYLLALYILLLAVQNLIFCVFINLKALKWQCHEIFCIFFHESNPSGPLINSLKWFPWKICFREDIHKKRDSTQCYTVLRRVGLRAVTLRRVGKLKCPKIQNWLTLRRVKNNLFWFLKTSTFRTFRIYVMIFRKYFEKSQTG